MKKTHKEIPQIFKTQPQGKEKPKRSRGWFLLSVLPLRAGDLKKRAAPRHRRKKGWKPMNQKRGYKWGKKNMYWETHRGNSGTKKWGAKEGKFTIPEK